MDDITLQLADGTPVVLTGSSDACPPDRPTGLAPQTPSVWLLGGGLWWRVLRHVPPDVLDSELGQCASLAEAGVLGLLDLPPLWPQAQRCAVPPLPAGHRWSHRADDLGGMYRVHRDDGDRHRVVGTVTPRHDDPSVWWWSHPATGPRRAAETRWEAIDSLARHLWDLHAEEVTP